MTAELVVADVRDREHLDGGFPIGTVHVPAARRTHASAEREPEAKRKRRWVPAVPVGVLALLAFGLRWFHLTRAYDVFVDEITYLRLGRSVASTGVPTLYGHPFYLHPPGFFWLEAAWLKVVGVSGDPIHQVHGMRMLNVVLAAATAGALVVLGRQMAGTAAGVVAALLFAVDPFVIRFDSRVLLETASMLTVLVGYAVLAGPLAQGRKIQPPQGLVAGLLFGLAVATKDVAVFLTLVPLGICFLLRWVMPRRMSLLIGASALIPYLLAALPTALTGRLDEALGEKGLGVQRLLGLVQITGFNAEGAPSFVSTILHNLSSLGTTYLFLGLCPLACMLLLLRKGRPCHHHLLGLLLLCAVGLLAYVVSLGTLEEQMFYFMVVPSMLAVAVLGTEFARRWLERWRPGRLAVLATLLAAVVLFDLTVWESTHLTRDDGYARLVAFMDEHVPHGSRVFATTETAGFVLTRFDARKVGSPQQVRTDHVRYVVASTKQTNEGYAFVDPPFVEWVKANARQLFVASGRSNGDLALYELRADPDWSRLPERL